VLPPARVDSAASAAATRMHSFLSRGDPGLSLGARERDIWEATYAPAYLPPVQGLLVARDGGLWLSRTGEGRGGKAWWVFSSDGARLGTAHTPTGLRVQVIGDGVVWGVATDDLDVNYIVRYRLSSSTPRS
jgi:hypothetical protein